MRQLAGLNRRRLVTGTLGSPEDVLEWYTNYALTQKQLRDKQNDRSN